MTRPSNTFSINIRNFREADEVKTLTYDAPGRAGRPTWA